MGREMYSHMGNFMPMMSNWGSSWNIFGGIVFWVFWLLILIILVLLIVWLFKQIQK